MGEIKWPPLKTNLYFSDESVAIYHADCRLLLPQLTEKFDLCLTDPPYGIDYQSHMRTVPFPKIYGDDSFPIWIFEELKPRVALFVWCRWDILNLLPPPKSLIVWDKGNHSMGDLQHEYARQWEAVAFYPGPEHAFKYRPTDIIRTMRIDPMKLVHPNEKPVEAIKPLIDAHEGELILDPFMGSGTTLRAAKDLGRRAIGIEINLDYVKIAVERMRQSILPLHAEQVQERQGISQLPMLGTMTAARKVSQGVLF